MQISSLFAPLSLRVYVPSRELSGEFSTTLTAQHSSPWPWLPGKSERREKKIKRIDSEVQKKKGEEQKARTRLVRQKRKNKNKGSGRRAHKDWAV